MPVGRAIGEDFHERVSLALKLALKGLLDRLTCRHDSLLIVESLACHVDRSLQLGDHLSEANRVAGDLSISPVQTTCCSLSDEGGGCHLTSGHSIDLVVDEDYCDILAAIGGMDRFCRADGSQVAITLIGENDQVRVDSLDPGGHGTGSAVGGLDAIEAIILVHGDRTADRGHDYGTVLDAKLVYRVSDDAHHQAMMATGAIAELSFGKAPWPLESLDHVLEVS
jgi:hypothetical protein